MKTTPAEVKRSLETISVTPQRMAEITQGWEETRLAARPNARAWSANEILAHLRSCADLWTHSIYAMLAENEPVFSDIDERKWAKATRYPGIPFGSSLLVFSMQRENLVGVLTELPLAAWERPAVVQGRRHTVFTQVRRTARHETDHLGQMRSILAGNRE